MASGRTTLFERDLAVLYCCSASSLLSVALLALRLALRWLLLRHTEASRGGEGRTRDGWGGSGG